jgi:putative cell wall-binding protein
LDSCLLKLWAAKLEGSRCDVKVSPKSRETLRPRRNLVRLVFAVIAMFALVVTAGALTSSPAKASDFVLSGTVTGADTHEPLANVSVTLFYSDPYEHYETSTDSAGNFQFPSVAVGGLGDYRLKLNRYNPVGGYVTEYFGSTPFWESATILHLSNSSNQVLSIELPVSGSIGGHATVSGTPRQFLAIPYAHNTVTNTWQSIDGQAAFDSNQNWLVKNLAPGNYKVKFVEYGGLQDVENPYYSGASSLEDATQITVTSGTVADTIDVALVHKPVVTRIGGSNRFATSALVAKTYGAAPVVFVANGLNYPDALSAAPAAALQGAPLLLTNPNYLSWDVIEEIRRLNPNFIVVVGGTSVVSRGVEAQLQQLVSNPSRVVRLAGANRYATSMAVFEASWGSDNYWGRYFSAQYSPSAFLADGRNFPDALASASAAGYFNGGVILVNGGAPAIPAGLGSALDKAKTTELYLAGGSAVLNTGIENTASALSGTTVERIFGENRYLTSWKINNKFFTEPADTIYLATGSGFADALAGAARAGYSHAPLYLVPGNCVPQNVLDAISSLGANNVVLLGGTGVLSSEVEALKPCSP